MEFSFKTLSYGVVDELLGKQGFPEYTLDFDQEARLYKATFADDTCIRELTLWAGAAFSCGLIECPRIERM